MIFSPNKFPNACTAVISFFGWFQADAKQLVSIPKSIEPFFENHCFDCHDTDTAKADLDLEGLTRSIVDVADAQNWQDILDQLNSGEMPPKKKAQPGKEELAKVVGDLTESLQSAQAMLKDSGGQIALRRINRREYQSTIKALL
ncbi:MAG: c-type cytochrome domain-containing protein, partial [Verrucomicrobiota bacterium]|nr:c-type cytochrome domain-containing protein [Verrucomicrobiota bacterium]